MSTPDGGKEITLAIRIDTARHAQLTWIAELRGSNLKQECSEAVDAYIPVVAIKHRGAEFTYATSDSVVAEGIS
ncbi:hypothetical protein [Nocardia farcinica]|uniref:hypothetical protein n=1 Tax=Nocardia farcinica TaxID=37329 RepID=UPI00031892B8|nr:hypothetical protein [Nocardia farcinica]